MRAKIFPLPTHASMARKESRLARRTHKGREVYTGLGHHCGVIPYSSVVWWIDSGAEDEWLQGKNGILRKGVLVLGELVWMRVV